MAQGDSPTGTCNIALAMLGEDPIVSVAPPDNNKRGRYCAQFYDSSRRAMLEARPWRCAKRQFQAAASATVPPFGWGAAYPVPADFIRLYDIRDQGMRWEVMNLLGIGVCVVTRAETPLDEEYIFDLTDCTQMSALLVKTIAADMAVMMALPLTRDLTLKEQCQADREAYLSLAATISAQQASPRPARGDVLARSRW